MIYISTYVPVRNAASKKICANYRMSSKPETINIMPGFRKDLCALIHFASDAIASLSFSFFLAIAVANASHAQQVVFEGCVDVRGIPVASIPAPIDDIAVAKLDPSGSPVILYSPQIAAEYDMATRLFFYFHECGHHALGHSLRRQPASEEQQADCWAIRTLVSRGLFSDRDISQVQADIAHFGKSDWTISPGRSALSCCGNAYPKILLARTPLLTRSLPSCKPSSAQHRIASRVSETAVTLMITMMKRLRTV
jgi:hypothetical protein